jgi:hydroxyacylglutathione hydrolase
MFIEQFYNKGLAQASYYISSDGVAVVIDPMRDVRPYLELAAKRKEKITYVLETHLHCDFVSGHLELARAVGATIFFGPGTSTGFHSKQLNDGDELEVGRIKLKVFHTPGHTMESSCFLLLDERDIPHSIFTGDTLFVDEVGRPDVRPDDHGVVQMASSLYDSISNRILKLPSYTIVYPGHGAGSVCGKTIGSEKHTTIGIQKQNNYALKSPTREDFISTVLEGLPGRPEYFSRCHDINRNGYESLDTILSLSCVRLTADQVLELLASNDILVVDTRPAIQYEKLMIKNSLHIGADGVFELTAAALIPPDKRLILVTEPGKSDEVIARLASVGLTNIAGYMDQNFQEHFPVGFEKENFEAIGAGDFASRFRYNSCQVIDVRNPDEWVPGFVAGSRLICLNDLENNISDLDKNKLTFVYCAENYRSLVAASVLKRNGFTNVVCIEGGISKLKETPVQLKQLSSI